ncbi:fumarylacetoacetate hydrolase family protein [Sphingobium boeckii]|uniref:2-keto-4-pentenoate hydratase/2-oxohepta-3-ene-1,7-dioic acid hydratase in catechol pathway n=1 Tax=Sphingobium boeckii TaxID=1082345 RepID=A0A7W9AFU5_9SPHN|nr:fumarylacetoacetate hydrolase family protein [Sphingobium boeckii]MBB5684895.1 2-keto-4-pentenoate hydratase/2-oxohepta-3-ene-1,7-dioic acid hydratase in catechol pathway [Sphingobium boeckii]
MRLITYARHDRQFLGAWINQDAQIVDLHHAATLRKLAELQPFKSMLDLIEAGDLAWDEARALIADAPSEALLHSRDITLLPPLPRPVQMRDFLCFEGHLIGAFKGIAKLAAQLSENPEQRMREIETRNDWPIPEIWYRQPIYYTANRLAIAAPEEDIVRPHYSRFFDFELEFAAVIGKGGRNIAREEARSHIFGYTIYNDWSARDEQTQVMQGMLGPGKAKDFDQGVTLGPCIVTADELPDPYDAIMKARVNGEQWSLGNSGDMYHKFEDCIADVTRSQTLFAGEVIGSGTVATGCGLEHMRFLADGDVVELEVSGIGVLRNRVVGSTQTG